MAAFRLRVGLLHAVWSSLFMFALALNARAQTYKVLYSFTGGADGGGVWGGVAMDKQGNLYGTTSGGGAYGYGTVFQLSPNSDGTWTETVLHSFANGDLDGQEPSGTPLLDAAGNVYVTAPDGGAYHGGTVLELTPNSGTWTLTVLYNFGSNSSDVGAPRDGMVADSKGNLYGPAVGGTNGGGGIFELLSGSAGWTEEVLYSFGATSSTGSLPFGTPVFDSTGNIYGVTGLGGSKNDGVVYELHKATGWSESELHQFTGSLTDGAEPGGSLVFDSKGNLYGATSIGGGSGCGSYGCGIIFKLAKGSSGWKESLVHKFGTGSEGADPVGGMIFDSAGNLYGATFAGGATTCGCGVVYRLTPNAHGAWGYRVLHTFSGSDGAGSVAALIQDSSGKLLRDDRGRRSRRQRRGLRDHTVTPRTSS